MKTQKQARAIGVLTPKVIRQFRKRQGWTVRELGEMLGYAMTYVKTLEIGRAPITEKFAARFDALRGRVYDEEITRRVIETRYRLPKRVLILARARRCPACKWSFIPRTPNQKYCGPECAHTGAQRRRTLRAAAPSRKSVKPYFRKSIKTPSHKAVRA